MAKIAQVISRKSYEGVPIGSIFNFRQKQMKCKCLGRSNGLNVTRIYAINWVMLTGQFKNLGKPMKNGILGNIRSCGTKRKKHTMTIALIGLGVIHGKLEGMNRTMKMNRFLVANKQ